MTQKTVKTIKASIRIMGKTYESKGKTVEEVITKLQPPIARGVGILSLEKGELRKERILNARIVNGIFGKISPILKSIHMKNIITLFNDFDK